jgi:Uma2 family endonuclease
MQALQEPRVSRYKLSVEQYHRMGEAGVLAPDARVELINGEVVDMAPMGTRHYSLVSRLQRMFDRAVGDRAIVNSQLPVRLSTHSEPEPDLSVLRARDDYYSSALPAPGDVLLLIEVSDSTVDYDLRTKAQLYATHGIAVYWVFDLPARLLHVHTQPRDGRYLSVVAQESPGAQAVPGVPGATIDLTGLLAG